MAYWHAQSSMPAAVAETQGFGDLGAMKNASSLVVVGSIEGESKREIPNPDAGSPAPIGKQDSVQITSYDVGVIATVSGDDKVVSGQTISVEFLAGFGPKPPIGAMLFFLVRKIDNTIPDNVVIYRPVSSQGVAAFDQAGQTSFFYETAEGLRESRADWSTSLVLGELLG
jgi:hypothetical protein